MSSSGDPETSRRRGRPSVAGERRAAIIEAHIQLISEQGSPTVPMADIAERAGVARTAISHFVGDHKALRVATIHELGRRYELAIRDAVGPDPTPENIIDLLFSRAWTTHRSTDDRAFDLLQATASRHPETRKAVRDAYALLVDELAAAITRNSKTSPQRAAAIAYAIVCLSESNTVLLDVGFPEHHSRDAAGLARSMLKTG
ncbi:TetR/AcrR family transcriptional regulator [Mycobacterium spongiae]|uniref:TetR/AcrR family transcriptional regulator n=1 Tax=Mycobacterium spongiae TaxID=886343 RepID=UPI001BAE0458|nr:TetR/AcrR family transcriptional regulator [Mycobacterium spongiae]